MEKPIKNWKLLENGINVVDAINALETQSYKGNEGTYAIKSEKTGRFITPFDAANGNSPDIATGRLSADFASKLIKMANDYGYGKSKTKPNKELVNFIEDNLISGYIMSKINTK